MSETTTGKQRDRDYPWLCSYCFKDEVYPDTVSYAADVTHDGQSYHLELPALVTPKCRACGELVFSYGVDDQIREVLRTRLRLLTPEQIRAKRESLGLKSEELAEKLGVAPETVSSWERGGMVQSRAMDNLLRIYFALPEVRAVLKGTDQDPNLGAKFETTASLVE